MTSTSTTNQDPVWHYLATHGEELHIMCCRTSRRWFGDDAYAEELFSDEVISRLHRLYEKWDKIRPFHFYVKSNCKFYCDKACRKIKERKEASIEQLTADTPFDLADSRIDDKMLIDNNDTIAVLFKASGISQETMLIVTLYFCKNKTTRQIAECINRSHVYVWNKVQEGLKALQSAANEMEIGGS